MTTPTRTDTHYTSPGGSRLVTLTHDPAPAHPCAPDIGYPVDTPAVRNETAAAFMTRITQTGWALTLATAITSPDGQVTGWDRQPITPDHAVGDLGPHRVLIGYDPARMDTADFDCLLDDLTAYTNHDCWAILNHRVPGYTDYAYGRAAGEAIAEHLADRLQHP